MPQFPSTRMNQIPRLSLVVPHEGDGDAFENSLVSVLQHRPCDCEVIVTHDGTYDDPFDLDDEVLFLDTATRSPVRQIAQAAGVAHGRFVQVIGQGQTVAAGWTDAALSEFEHHDAGVIVPVVRDADDHVICHVGFRCSSASACLAVGFGETDVSRTHARTIDGGFLSSAFWRRDLLRSMAGTYRGDDWIESSLVYALAARAAGWRCLAAKDSVVYCADDDTIDRVGRNHRRLQAIVDQFGDGGWGNSVSRFCATALGVQGGLMSAWSRATAPLAAAAVGPLIDTTQVLHVDDCGQTVRMPVRTGSANRKVA